MVSKETQQVFTFETMAVVLYCMLESGINLGTQHYKMMSAIDGKRGPDGFQHQFRKVKARAKELQEQAKDGSIGTPVKNVRGGNTATTPSGDKSRNKRRKAAGEMEEHHGRSGDDDDEGGDKEGESPSKKPKIKAEIADDFPF